MSGTQPLTRWSFDTEDDSKGRVYWVNFYNGVEHFAFDNPHRAVEWLLTQEGEFWAVNLEYDLINLFGALLEPLCVLTYGGFGLLKASVYGKRVRFYNTLRHWAMSVEEMGERLGFPKLPFDPTNLAYCQRDCEVTYRFMDEMLERYRAMGIEEVKATLPSTALKFFTTKFCHVPWERNPSIEVWKFLGRARYGGRTEIFQLNPVRGRIYEFDINSSYPYAMKVGIFPDLTTCRPFLPHPNLEKEGVALATVSARSMEFPVLPWKADAESKLLFPFGKFTGTWTYAELRYALEHGYTLEKIHQAVEYDAMASPFAEYIEFLYSRRLEVKDSDPLLSYTLKIAMNSTYGKFGEEGELNVLSRGTRYSMAQIPKHSNMVWSAYILAYGRMQLYRYLKQASAAGQVLYCDTDSLFIKASKPPFVGSKELGKLGLKGCYNYAHFKLPKLYQVDKHYKAKGIPADKLRKGDEEHLKREFFHNGIAEFQKPFRLVEARRLKEQPNVWRQVTKELTSAYDKRRAWQDGRTWPLELVG